MSYQTSLYSADVDQLMVTWEEALAKRPRTRMGSLRHFLKKIFVDPLLFAVVTLAFLVVPQSFLLLASKKRVAAALQRFFIRTMDIVIAIIGLFISLPVWIIVPMLIKLDSSGPVFYRQMRTGIDRRRGDRRVVSLGHGVERRSDSRRTVNLHGKPFYIIKFRTMTVDAEKGSGAVWAKQNDPRVTPIGNWLRRCHMDEIPQLLNVLRGDMSMIGPRPERPEIIDKLIEEIPEYCTRLQVKPGVTGPAQIFLGYDRCMGDIRRKIQFDSLYIENRSLRFYFLLLALTAVKILSSIIVIPTGMFNLNITLEEDSRQSVTYSH